MHPDKQRRARHVLTWIEDQPASGTESRCGLACRHLVAPHASPSSSHKDTGSKSRSTQATARRDLDQRHGQGTHQRSATRPSVTRGNAPSKAPPSAESIAGHKACRIIHGNLTGGMRGMPAATNVDLCAHSRTAKLVFPASRRKARA